MGIYNYHIFDYILVVGMQSWEISTDIKFKSKIISDKHNINLNRGRYERLNDSSFS